MATAGDEPWSQLSEHLFLTGNTYALASRDGPVLLVDPYGDHLVEQIDKLRADYKLGPVEVCLVSHAHNDHYKGLYLLPERESFQTWALSDIAAVLEAPYERAAPYLDARPLRIDRVLRDPEPDGSVRWREYEFRFHHLPGQTVFSMGWEATIDGKRCFHTADNFFHMDQFSGSGGWSGRNRALPGGYAASAQKVLDVEPDWVLCEHGGAMEFNAEDFRRRVAWAEAAAQAADALSPTGDHTLDWSPYLVEHRPVYLRLPRGGRLDVNLVFGEGRGVPFNRGSFRVLIEAPGLIDVVDTGSMGSAPGGYGTTRSILATAPLGRYVLPVTVVVGEEEWCDTFVVVDVVE
jgi:glyoxylase-like metal-dependent hydrolase (beta-lactamase superfamily II)